jgi:hypothetical protein
MGEMDEMGLTEEVKCLEFLDNPKGTSAEVQEEVQEIR